MFLVRVCSLSPRPSYTVFPAISQGSVVPICSSSQPSPSCRQPLICFLSLAERVPFLHTLRKRWHTVRRWTLHLTLLHSAPSGSSTLGAPHRLFFRCLLSALSVVWIQQLFYVYIHQAIWLSPLFDCYESCCFNSCLNFEWTLRFHFGGRYRQVGFYGVAP